MYEIEELKYDFAVKSSGSFSFCQACLSSDRSLFSIGDYVDVFRNISNNILPQPLFLCWECMAMLKKIKLFKDKLEEAQRILTYHFLNKQKLLLQTLSKLTKTYTDHTIVITHIDEEDDCKQKVAIKQENEHSNDSFHYYDENNDFCLQEIKKENEIYTKATKKNKSLHYRIVYEKNAKKAVRKKFAIQPGDSKIWLDRERNSDFYKKFKYNCKLCLNGFSNKDKLKRHILKYHDESAGSHICPTCNMRFISEPSLSAHLEAHEFAWECAHCGFQCYSVRRLNAHVNTHSAVQCVYCEAKFQDLATFYTHYKSLHSIYLCDHCGKRCKTKHMLEKHMSRHLDSHTCSACSRHYKSRAALRKHFSLKHSSCVAEQAYCVLCDKQYESEHVYRRHVHTSAAHRRERESQVKKKFPCPECSNTYSRRAYMMNHYRHVHMNQSKYYCSDCDRHFLNRTRYVDHMRFNHEGVKKEKNKLCNICGRGFAANRTLLNHMRTHSGERPYECEYCSAKFTQRTSMLSHVKYIHMKSKRRPQWQQ